MGGTLINASDFFVGAARRLGNLALEEDIKKEFWAIVDKNSFLSEEQALILACESVAEINGLDASGVAGIMGEFLLTKSSLEPSAFDTLAYFKEKNVGMIVASDSDYYLLIEELTKHNIVDFFDDVITSSVVGAYKPSDLFAKHLSGILKEFVDSTVFFVGDSDADIKTALKIGAIPIFISGKSAIHKQAKYNISRLSELKLIVDKY